MAQRIKRRRTVRSRPSTLFGKKSSIVFTVLLMASIFIGFFRFREGVLYYLGFKTDKYAAESATDERKLTDIRIYEVLYQHDQHALGFDVSEYQGNIDWEQTYHIDEAFELSFVFIRATAGSNKKDARFNSNWRDAKARQLICGAYHYYRPNENSVDQARNFIQQVRLQKGDLPPVLDIEKLPKSQSVARLKKGLRRWLELIEAHYNVKPIIYSGERYYADFLRKEFSDYPLWIANYNFWRNTLASDWEFWQFTEKAKIAGIAGNVDLNIFKGDKNELMELGIQ
jgi:lysozyme